MVACWTARPSNLEQRMSRQADRGLRCSAACCASTAVRPHTPTTTTGALRRLGACLTDDARRLRQGGSLTERGHLTDIVRVGWGKWLSRYSEHSTRSSAPFLPAAFGNEIDGSLAVTIT